MKVGFVLDPPERIDLVADSSLRLMHECQQRGHELIYIQPEQLMLKKQGAYAWARSVTVQYNQPCFDFAAFQEYHLDDLDLVLMRKDPPFDQAYMHSVLILKQVRKAKVLNRPSSLLRCNEKLSILEFPDFIADTCVSSQIDRLLSFFEPLNDDAVVKPLDLAGGAEIFVLRQGDSNLRVILESITRMQTRQVMLQRYIPEVTQGDKRILLLNGKVIGSFQRVQDGADHRQNLHRGGHAKIAELTQRDEEICKALEPWLVEHGLFFVGIDLLGEYLTEINVTSPMGIVEINKLHNTQLEKTIVDAFEELVG